MELHPAELELKIGRINICAALWCIAAIVLLAFEIQVIATSHQHARQWGFAGLMMVSLLYLIASIGLMLRKRWAAWPVLVCAALSVIMVPVGTIISVLVFSAVRWHPSFETLRSHPFPKGMSKTESQILLAVAVFIVLGASVLDVVLSSSLQAHQDGIGLVGYVFGSFVGTFLTSAGLTFIVFFLIWLFTRHLHWNAIYRTFLISAIAISVLAIFGQIQNSYDEQAQILQVEHNAEVRVHTLAENPSTLANPTEPQAKAQPPQGTGGIVEQTRRILDDYYQTLRRVKAQRIATRRTIANLNLQRLLTPQVLVKRSGITDTRTALRRYRIALNTYRNVYESALRESLRDLNALPEGAFKRGALKSYFESRNTMGKAMLSYFDKKNTEINLINKIVDIYAQTQGNAQVRDGKVYLPDEYKEKIEALAVKLRSNQAQVQATAKRIQQYTEQDNKKSTT